VLLNPLPYAAPDRMVKFWLSAPQKGLPVVELPQGLFVFPRPESDLRKDGCLRQRGFQSNRRRRGGAIERRQRHV
jgi:hypothetical protein